MHWRLAACMGIGWLAALGCGAEPAPESPPAPESASEWDGLVFLRDAESGRPDLWAARVSTGETMRLHETPGEIEDAPRWVPSVLRIVYQVRSVARPDRSRLRLLEPRTGARLAAAERGAEKEGRPVVSRDGKLIAFSFVDPPGQVPPRGVRLLRPMTGRQDDLPAVPGASAYPNLDVSPDATAVVVQTYTEGRPDDLWMLLGSGRKGLSVSRQWRDVGPRFSHDGARVVFTRAARETEAQTRVRVAAGRPPKLGGGDICQVPLAGGRATCPVQSGDAREFGVAPSPTAPEMVYLRDRDGQVDVYLSGLAGQDERRLTDTPERERSLAWSPDGRWIALVAGPPEERRVQVLDPDGKILFETPGFSPAWTPPLL